MPSKTLISVSKMLAKYIQVKVVFNPTQWFKCFATKPKEFQLVAIASISNFRIYLKP